jgi:23S rRNA (cytosine1962-C5)-methyltransferase
MYSIGFSALVGNNLINSYFSRGDKNEFGELYLADKFGKKLPLGTFVRFSQ